MKRPVRRKPEPVDSMNALIDVVFLLLVFFVCAATGSIADQILPADLQGDATEAVQPVEPQTVQRWEHPILRIRLQPAAGDQLEILLNDQPQSDTEQLRSALTQLAQLDPASTVVLSIHDDVNVGRFIAIYDLCQQLQFENISFAISAGGRSQGSTGSGSLPVTAEDDAANP
jgi:biopolymer transport protein ExbD